MLSHFWPGLPSCCPVCTPVHISHLYLCLSYISIFFSQIFVLTAPCAYFSSIFVPKVITNEYFWYVTLSTLIVLQKWAFFVRPITQCIFIVHSFVAVCWYLNYFHALFIKRDNWKCQKVRPVNVFNLGPHFYSVNMWISCSSSGCLCVLCLCGPDLLVLLFSPLVCVCVFLCTCVFCVVVAVFLVFMWARLTNSTLLPSCLCVRECLCIFLCTALRWKLVV